MPNSDSAATFHVGDKVIVNYMGEEREALVVGFELAKRPSSRRFYALEIAGVLGHPAYEDFEIRHA